MQLALRPYVTTGVALVGASVLVAAPISVTPPDIQMSNPTVQVERAVQLTANEIENAVNKLVFAATEAGVSIAQLTTPLVAQILGVSETEAAIFLALGTIGLFGPLISGTGAIGTALQDIVDSDGLEELLNNLIGAPGTIADGFVNGGYGPNLVSLLGLGLPTTAYTLLAGGLINPGDVEDLLTYFAPGTYVASGAIPTLQSLVDQLFGLFSTTSMSAESVSALAAPAPDSTIEDGINSLLYTLTGATLSVVELGAPLVAKILGVSEADAEAFLGLATVGLLGPAISGTGAVGTALQNIVNSDGIGELVTNLIGAPGTVADGVVNGGYGPNLLSLLPALQAIPGANEAFAPGLIQNPGFIYGLLPGGIGLKPNATGLSLLPPGTIAVLQGLVEQVFGALPSAASANTAALRTSEGTESTGEDQSNLTLTENKGVEGGAAAEGPEVTPKKHRPRVELNVFKLNPLDQNNNSKDADGAAADNKDAATTTTAKHELGFGKTPVRDLVKKVLGGGNDDDDKDSAAEPAKTAAE
ncbi:hypothetical protein [Mycolicibacterium stellerae]|uniref:hypothetical protein n=1 Tax=Mycolicibacterium stellerae TaxID=2358193 RepID=UPI000F0B15B7|nr:hypothetical protein [Mycolicibacterium stellerae]